MKAMSITLMSQGFEPNVSHHPRMSCCCEPFHGRSSTCGMDLKGIITIFEETWTDLIQPPKVIAGADMADRTKIHKDYYRGEDQDLDRPPSGSTIYSARTGSGVSSSRSQKSTASRTNTEQRCSKCRKHYTTSRTGKYGNCR